MLWQDYSALAAERTQKSQRYLFRVFSTAGDHSLTQARDHHIT